MLLGNYTNTNKNFSCSIESLKKEINLLKKEIIKLITNNNILLAKDKYEILLDKYKFLLFFEPELYSIEYAYFLIFGVEKLQKDKSFLDTALNFLKDFEEESISYLKNKINLLKNR